MSVAPDLGSRNPSQLFYISGVFFGETEHTYKKLATTYEGNHYDQRYVCKWL